MTENQLTCNFYFEDLQSNRKKLFEQAIHSAKRGKVLYILSEELKELPELSQDISLVNRQYMKMISFLYAKTLRLLIESISTLPDWQSVPSTIILDDLSAYCDKNQMQNACGIVALLIDTVRSCSLNLNTPTSLYISASLENVDDEYCYLLTELYSTSE